ncbi:MAG: xanthine dehydrogenase family protein molybdopterin-binding subunit, partial [Acidobacteriota bacterium]|nr:xanthine dehydrogenase family protein molybdopterin-binding subunit [Acidobacteriota bacterium]
MRETSLRENIWTPEPERYELSEKPLYDFTADRRDFLRILGGGILVCLILDPQSEAQESGGRRRGPGQAMPQELGAWLHISDTGAITVYTGKVEMGQNIRTSLTQAVAEELRTKPAMIQLVMGDTELTPYDFGTVGSMTTPIMAPQLHKVAAAAREMLLDLAAEHWRTDRATLTIADGAVRNANGQALSFGELTHGQKLTRTVTADVRVTPATEWKIAGHDLHKINAHSIVTGREKFTSDMKLPGMLYGRVVRPAAFKATLASADLKPAQQIPGVIPVRDGDFVGVAADDSAKLDKAAAAIRTDWKTTPQISARDLYPHLKANPAALAPAEGDVHLDTSYTVAYIAHTPLEPRAAVAQWEEGKLTVWTGTQRPFGVRSELAQAFGIPEDRVRV